MSSSILSTRRWRREHHIASVADDAGMLSVVLVWCLHERGDLLMRFRLLKLLWRVAESLPQGFIEEVVWDTAQWVETGEFPKFWKTEVNTRGVGRIKMDGPAPPQNWRPLNNIQRNEARAHEFLILMQPGETIILPWGERLDFPFDPIEDHAQPKRIVTSTGERLTGWEGMPEQIWDGDQIK